MKLTYDPTVDALYFTIAELPEGRHRATVRQGDDVLVDYIHGGSGGVLGIEVLNASVYLGLDYLKTLPKP